MISVYNFQDPVDFLSAYITKQQEESSDFSLKELAHGLGLRSSVPLIDILKRKKKFKDNFAKQLAQYLEIDNTEKMYFEALVAKSNSTSEERMRMYDLIMQELKPSIDNKFHPLYAKELDIFSHWIYTAILALSELPNFELTVKNINKRLIKNLDEKLVQDAIFELLQHQVLTINKDGIVLPKYTRTTTKSGAKDTNVNNYYKMVCELAKESLDVPVEKREFHSFSFSIAEKNIPLAKEVIRKCRNNLSKLSQKDPANQVYQANLMLFPLTK